MRNSHYFVAGKTPALSFLRRALLFLAMITCFSALTSAQASTPRELLIHAAFQASSKNAALSDVTVALAATDKILATRPKDIDAQFQKGIALGYRAKLTRSVGDAKAARQIFEKLAAQDRNNGEYQMAVACWNLDAISDLGSFIARTMVGARAATGHEALNRAAQMSPNDVFILGMAAMVTIRNDESAVAAARALAERTMKANAQSSLDRMIQQAMGAILQHLRAGQGAKAAALARKRLPLGTIL